MKYGQSDKVSLPGCDLHGCLTGSMSEEISQPETFTPFGSTNRGQPKTPLYAHACVVLLMQNSSKGVKQARCQSSTTTAATDIVLKEARKEREREREDKKERKDKREERKEKKRVKTRVCERERKERKRKERESERQRERNA